jgi:WD40 repeat protein
VIEDFNFPNMLGLEDSMKEAIGGDNSHLDKIRDALQLSSNILRTDPSQLTGQLLGRLTNDLSPQVRDLLANAAIWRRSPWLHPLTSSLIPPGRNLLRSFDIADGSSEALIITPSKKIVCPSGRNSLKVYDSQTGEEIRVLRGHSDLVRSIAIDADGQHLISASEDKTLRVWDLVEILLTTTALPFLVYQH